MIDKDEAIRLLRKSVANKGEGFIYEKPVETGSCQYFYNNEPSCIVGHALADVGVTQEFMGVSNKSSVGIFSNRLGMPDGLADIVDDEAISVFDRAQSHQDTGSTWGYALEQAEHRYRELGGTE